MKHHTAIVVGGGASGLFCAKNLQERNIDILLLEKMKTPGRKLLITGGGMCNLTRDDKTHVMLDHYGNKGRFLGAAFSKFSPQDTVKWFEDRGVPLHTREDKKIFPKSKKAHDILNTLFDNTYPAVFNYKVEEIIKKGELFIINNEYSCKYLVIATGGITYPTTGSTGDGHEIARTFKHNIINVKPSLTALKVISEDLKPLEGISLHDVEVNVPKEGKKNKYHSNGGDLLFTGNGISGPAVLDISRHCESNHEIYLNFNKTINPSNENILLSNYIRRETQLPARFIDYILKQGNITNLPCNQTRKACYEYINGKLKHWEMKISLKGTIKFGMSTEGGVSTKEINNKTFESKLIDNLYFIGEVVDFSGDCGGYNLQACWSTAFSAANDIVQTNI